MNKNWRAIHPYYDVVDYLLIGIRVFFSLGMYNRLCYVILLNSQGILCMLAKTILTGFCHTLKKMSDHFRWS